MTIESLEQVFSSFSTLLNYMGTCQNAGIHNIVPRNFNWCETEEGKVEGI